MNERNGWLYQEASQSERLVGTGDFNRSMQHLSSNYRAEDVADEAKTKDLLQRRAEELDVGSLAGRRFSA
jgi:hypothetical protein